MAKAKWVKVQTDMFDNPKIKVIDSMENNNLIHYIWINCIVLAGRANNDGKLYLSDDIPYTLKTLSISVKRTLEEVKEAFKVFKKLNMIEVTEDKVFRLKGWDEYQNIDGLEKMRKQSSERVAKYREKKREEKRAAEEVKKDNSSEDNIESPNENIDSDINNDLKNKNNNSKNKSNENNDIELSKESMNVSENISDEIIENNKSVTCNIDSNVTCNAEDNVTYEKKSESETLKNKKQNKKQSKKKREKETNGIAEDDSISHDKNIYAEAIELSQYCEKITGKLGLLDVSALNMAIDMHGSDNVKQAIQAAIEQGKVSMTYICGILRNWSNEGYPKNDGIGENNKNKDGGKGYGGKCNKKGDGSDKNEFEHIQPQEPRKLSEEERKRVCENVI